MISLGIAYQQKDNAIFCAFAINKYFSRKILHFI